MITLTTGNILEANADALVNTVNCVGVMGRGIALQFRKAFPENFRAYEAACRSGEVAIGRMFVVETRRLDGPRYIINFPTKNHWRGSSRIEFIRSGLQDLVEQVKRLQIGSIAIPPLGCGLGGLNWNEVKPVIEEALATIPEVHVWLYPPDGAPQARAMVRAQARPRMTPGRAALIGLMNRYLAGLMDPVVSLLEVQKLTYFMQEAGEPLRLHFKKHIYGPYADNLRHVLTDIEGHFVAGYADAGDNPEKELELLPGAIEEAEAFLQSHADTRKHFARVTALVDGFESPFGMELLASVHWLVVHDHAQSVAEVISRLHDWNARKRRFTDRQVELAWNTLASQHWLPHAEQTAVAMRSQ